MHVLVAAEEGKEGMCYIKSILINENLCNNNKLQYRVVKQLTSINIDLDWLYRDGRRRHERKSKFTIGSFTRAVEALEK